MMTRVLVCLAVFQFGAGFAIAQSRSTDLDQNMASGEIERLLDQKRDMVFEEATLEEFAKFIEACGISVHLDERALDDVGIAIDTPITFRQPAITLRDGLRLVLDSIYLTWTPRNGRLVITSQEEAENQLITRVYDVRNLVELVPVQTGGGFGGGPTSYAYQYDFDTLIDTISSTIEPDSWEDMGGPASIGPYYTRRMRVLVIAQTYDAHRQVQSLLSKMAEHGGKTPLPSAAAYSIPTQRSATVVSSPASLPIRTRGGIRSSQLRTTGQ
jgi:hypothetical protein